LADPQLASWARIALEAIPDPAADAALRDALKRLDGLLLVGAINSLGVRRDTQSVPALAERLSSDDAEVAVAAALALGRIGTTAAAEQLEPQLLHADPAVRSAAAEGCVRCAEQLAKAGSVDRAVQLADAARAADVPRPRKLEATRAAIVLRASAGVPLLEEQLRAADRHFFALGLTTARELPGQEVTESIAALVGQLPPERQALVMLVLADRHDPAALPAVLQAARSGEIPVRLAAIEALAQLGDAQSVAVLLEIAQDRDAELVRAALDALVALPGPEIDAQIMSRLEAAPGQLRRQLIELVGRRRITAAVPALIAALQDSDAAVRLQAVVGLGETIGQDQLEVMIDYLVRAADGSQRDVESVRKAVLSASVRMPDREACAELLAAAMRGAPQPGQTALLETLAAVGGTRALQAVAAAAQGDHPELQDLASRLLGNWMTPDAAPVLLKLAEQPRYRFQVRALRGLIRIARQFVLEDEERAELIRGALQASRRRDEKLLVLEVLERYPSLATLDIATEAAKDAAVYQDAVKSALIIAQALPESAGVQERLERLGLKPVEIEIVQAEYGADDKLKDVTEIVRRHVGRMPLIALPGDYNSALGGDPAPNVQKQLIIRYRVDGREGTGTFRENQLILLTSP
jgi:HEAT repeat protein